MKSIKSILLAALVILGFEAFAQKKEIILLAHRGGCGEGMENVESTFKKSLAAGIKAFEIDVRITKDGKIVLQHDNTLKRTAGIDRHVEDMTEKELREVTLNDGSKLLFFDEFLKLMSKHPGLFVEIEMKSSKYSDEFLYGSGYSDKIAKMALKAKPAESTYVFTSFDTRPLRYIKAHYPAAETGYITGAGVNHETIAVALAIGATRMAAHIDRTTRADMDRAHRKGLLVNLWPGKSDDSLLRAWSLGADIHCTDYPSHMLDYAKKYCSWLTIK
jgi:glycerophosphoryl diester phosphodiesterase